MSIRNLTKLFETISAHDWPQAEVAAGDIIRDEEKKRHHTAAQVLKGALRPNALNGAERPITISPVQSLAGVLSQQITKARLNDVMLSKQSKEELQTIAKEWKHRARLQSVGITRRNRLFFHGPPGCGKSMTACALGNELSLPTYLVRFDAVIGAYLGQTATHLRQLFQFAETTPSILLIDEVDALAKKRGNPLDVGELDRIVIALMQELEHSHPQGIVIATSNLPANIDKALWRRFDLVLEFKKPRPTEMMRYASRLAGEYRIKIPPSILRHTKMASSYAEVRAMVEGVARRIALESV